MNEPSTIGGDGPAAAMGLTYEEIGPELVRATVPVSDAIRQPQGLVHGGVHPLIAESITSHATLQVVADDGKIAMAQSNSATFLRPITAGTIHATGRRRHAGRGTWIWDVEIADDEERLCAMVRMTIAVRPRPPVYTADP